MLRTLFEHIDKTYLDDVKKDYEFYLFLFSLLVLGMGTCRLYGRRTWLQWEKSRRKKAGLPVASLLSQDTAQSWRYSDLYQSGLWGVAMMGIGAVFNPVWNAVSNAVLFRTLHESVVANVYNGIRSTIFSALLFIIFSIKQAGGYQFIMRHSPGLIIILIAGFVAPPAVAAWLDWEPTWDLVAINASILVILFLCVSYALGMTEGLRIADPALNYPLVTLEARDGKTIDRAWLYERTDSDYRLVTESGSNHIVPSATVIEIRGPVERPENLAGQGNSIQK
jgi:hypothetical protein